MASSTFNKPHFFFSSNAISHSFTSPVTGGGKSKTIPRRNRSAHSGKLRGDLITVSNQLESVKDEASDLTLQMGIGIQVEFESFPNIELAVESLANATQGIDLHNIKSVVEGGEVKTIATVFIPDGKLHSFEKKITDYLNEKKTDARRPLDNQKLVDAIQSIRTAAFSAIWSEEAELLPESKDISVWWEVWLSTPRRSKETSNRYIEIVDDFRLVANQIGIEVSSHKLRFPEHTVLQVKATQQQLESSSLFLSRVAEIRCPKITAEFFDSSTKEEQVQWSQDLLGRLHQTDNSDAPYICIIDTGVNVEHPLLSPFATTSDQLTITHDQDATDNNGHGTGMAGLAMWGDLTDALNSDEQISIQHKLESVKVLNNSGDNRDRPLGSITSDAISIVEIENPHRSRAFSMSLSAATATDRGRASSWSSTLDSLAVDYTGEGSNPRLFTVCAGNAPLDANMSYPEHNQLQDIHDPAQAWNVITVGAYTDKVTLSESSDYEVLANKGGLSPYSTTSLMWDRKNAPIKPEVMFEGGNMGKDSLGCVGMHDLHLLTTHSDFSQRHFQTSHATSAATALGSRFVAQVKSKLPNAWPETIRALTVHSADWTDEMYKLISTTRRDHNIKKSDMAKLVRMVGYGTPNLERAINSAKNSLSLVIEDELQPFFKAKDIKTKDMHLHDLPWPKVALQALGHADVELTVTLSYFIEPNPSSKNILNKYSYASHQLRFDVKRPLESEDDFQKRINKASRESKEDKPDSSDDSNWVIGKDNRHRGSIHKDIWRGNAAELAERGQIAIFPASGWWKTRKSHERYNSKARYSLIVSLSVPTVDVDIYTEVETKIANTISARSVVDINI